MKKLAVAFVVLGLSGTAAGAMDLGELTPCWAAATKFCDRSGGMTWSNLLRGGDTLSGAKISHREQLPRRAEAIRQL